MRAPPDIPLSDGQAKLNRSMSLGTQRLSQLDGPEAFPSATPSPSRQGQ